LKTKEADRFALHREAVGLIFFIAVLEFSGQPCEDISLAVAMNAVAT
jgi:hypothetical protein